MKNVPQTYITDIKSIEIRGSLKIVVYTEEICNYAVLNIYGSTYKEKHNYIEPYERKAHVFHVPCSYVKGVCDFTFTFTNCAKESKYFECVGEQGTTYGTFDPSTKTPYDVAFEEDDSKIEIQNYTDTQIADGVVSRVFDCVNKNGAKVKAFALYVDPKKATMEVGTPNNEYKAGNCSQTFQGEIDAAVRDGLNVVAATNADFFDMHDTCMPSGLVIKNGVIVANENSDRPFFAIEKNGMPLISSNHDPDLCLDDIYSAVCGREVILYYGEPFDLALCEPFGTTRHPRTCVGICPDNTFIILVVDGRIPDYSNGASLTDLCLFLQKLGAVDGINLDGGGSSTMIVKKENGFEMINHPADLHRPFDNLIRDVYNSMLIVSK